jgi:hypothetical protein
MSTSRKAVCTTVHIDTTGFPFPTPVRSRGPPVAHMLILMLVPMPMRFLLSTRCNTQRLIHRHERHKADQDGHTQQQIPIGLDQDEPRPPRRIILAHKDLRQQVE